MERKISLADLQKAVVNAYEQYKSDKDGTIDALNADADAKDFGISVVLTDGTVVNKGDTQKGAALGRIALLPTHVALLQQLSPADLVKKAGVAYGDKKKETKPKGLGISMHGVRAVSVLQPSGDSDGKWDVMINNLINLIGSAPVLDDKLYERLQKRNADNKVIDAIADAQYGLYDQSDIAVNLYTRLEALTLTTEQYAALGATLAADGVNPLNKQIAFDGSVAANAVATIGRGVHHEGKAWMQLVGLPATNSFSGAIVAVLPGFGAIAAYAPQLDANGVSVRAAQAIAYIARELQLNVYASARVSVEK